MRVGARRGEGWLDLVVVRVSGARLGGVGMASAFLHGIALAFWACASFHVNGMTASMYSSLDNYYRLA